MKYGPEDFPYNPEAEGPADAELLNPRFEGHVSEDGIQTEFSGNTPNVMENSFE